MKVKFKAFAQFSVLALLAASCTSNPDSAGLEYMPDMYRSPAIEPYVDYGEIGGKTYDDLKERVSAMTPPKYTIPYYGTDSATVSMMLPYVRQAGNAFGLTHGLFYTDLSSNPDANYDYNMAAADMNPIKLKNAVQADAVFAEGKKLFTANCQHCHGEKGDGQGPMVTSGAFSGVPDYKTLQIAEGQMFYSIYYGKGSMGAHSSLVNKKEIWTLVHYIKKFQDAKHGTFDENGNPVTAEVAPATPVAPVVAPN